jgi:hypothetical protein
LLDFPQRLRYRIRFWSIAQRLAQKILHRRLPVQLINVTVLPFVAGPNPVRDLRYENRFARQKRGDGSA